MTNMARVPLTSALVLATAIGAVAGLLVALLIVTPNPSPALPARDVPASTIVVQVESVLHVPTATPTSNPTPPPSRPSPSPTPIPYPYCFAAQPGELCIPSRVLTPTLTPTFPPCSSGQTRALWGVELCELDATPVFRQSRD